MKKNNIKYVLIPAFAAAALFPVLANDNQAKANDDKAATTSTVNKPETTTEKSTSIPTTNNVAETTATTPANPANSVKPEPAANVESANSANVNNEVVKPKVPLTEAEYKQKSALELAQLIREKRVTSTELVDLAYKVIAEENPKLNAVLTTENGKIPHAIVEEAYRTAKEIDNRVKQVILQLIL